ncbi:hypothetical protein [Dialister sp.]|jgi:hypothetical protein|uniref:hypothetical protein n=1 Tax=Dialister sp. TaxID=1955814 RepID=UPI003A5C74F8
MEDAVYIPVTAAYVADLSYSVAVTGIFGWEKVKWRKEKGTGMAAKPKGLNSHTSYLKSQFCLSPADAAEVQFFVKGSEVRVIPGMQPLREGARQSRRMD